MIVLATNNSHKLQELRAIMGDGAGLRSLADIGFSGDIPEMADTLQGNALQKARYIHSRYDCDVIADDTGLEVDALGGAPGVHSARYAAQCSHDAASDHDSTANMAALLHNMQGVADRRARFRTVIAYIKDGREHLFEGMVEGEILSEPAGNGGFGYDPLFKPVGWDKTFAEATEAEKNAVSHRGRASRSLLEFIKNTPQ